MANDLEGLRVQIGEANNLFRYLLFSGTRLMMVSHQRYLWEPQARKAAERFAKTHNFKMTKKLYKGNIL